VTTLIEVKKNPLTTMSGHPELLDIDLLQEAESEDWDEYVANHAQGTIYHTLAWRKVTEEGFGHRPYYLRAKNSTGRIAGVLPMFFVGGLFGRRLVSMPMRDRGGVLAENHDVSRQLIEKAKTLTKNHDCKFLELRTTTPLEHAIQEACGLQLEQNWITTRIDLSVGLEALWKAIDKDAARWAVNKARRLGSKVTMDNSKSGIELFYKLFVRTRMDMGIPPFPKELFEAIWQHLIQPGKANLFIVWHEETPTNAMINLLSGKSFIPAYAAPQRQWRKYYPSDLMFWHTIEWAVQNGFEVYDFGADSHRQESLLRFKRKWGGVHESLYYYYALNGIERPAAFDSSSSGNLLLRKVWQFLPHAFGRPLGAWLTRQLS